MNSEKGFTVYKNNINKKNIAVLISLLILVFALVSIPVVQYKTAPKKAENAVAVYLSQKNKDALDSRNFTSINKTYYTIKIKNFKYIVEISGSADYAVVYKSYETSFYAKVVINPFSNNVKIIKLKANNETIIE